MIRSITFIGSGNVATRMARAFHKKGFTIQEIWSRNIEHASKLAEVVSAGSISDLNNINTLSDLYILAVPDDYIDDLAMRLNNRIPDKSILVHTSGSVSQEVLNVHDRYGVLYPLQSFTSGRKVKFKRIPMLINGSNQEVRQALIELASYLSKTVVEMADEKRKKLHLAAVILNNFTNHLSRMAKSYTDAENIDFKLFKPLLIETVAKIYDLGPDKAQTGPAKRGDLETIEKHLNLLAMEPSLKSLYQSLSQSIIEYENSG